MASPFRHGLERWWPTRASAPAGAQDAALAGFMPSWLEAAPDAMLAVSPGGGIVHCNRLAAQLLGYEAGALCGQPLAVLLPARLRDRHARQMAGYWQAPGTRPMGRGFELLALRRDGVEVPVEISLSPLELPDGLLVLCAVRDLTLRQQQEHALQQARVAAEREAKAHAEILARVAHELRLPLHALLGALDDLQPTALSGEQRRCLRLLQTAGASIAGIVRDLVELAGMEAAPFARGARCFDLRERVQGIVDMVGLDAKAKGLTVTLHVDERLPASVIGDPERLGQVLFNLMRNAVMFTEAGSVSVRVRPAPEPRSPAHAWCTVEDTGIGLEQEDLARLLGPLDAEAPAAGFSGLRGGLGLNNARQLVSLMGGHFWADSQPGIGSAFHFTVSFDLPPAPSGA